jgi:hypothetical protein
MALIAPGIIQPIVRTWATRPTAANYSGHVIFISDAGTSGALFRSDGTNWVPMAPITYLDSPQAAITGSLTETALATITIPGGLLGTKGQIEVSALWSYTNNANSKSLKVKLGATAFLSVSKTTTANDQTYTRIMNLTASTQEGLTNASEGAVGATAIANTTGAIDTTADAALTLTATLGNVADTITLKSYIAKLFPRN